MATSVFLAIDSWGTHWDENTKYGTILSFDAVCMHWFTSHIYVTKVSRHTVVPSCHTHWFPLATSNTQDSARLDVAVNGFWGGRSERCFIDVRVFNSFAPSNIVPPLCRPPLGSMKRLSIVLMVSGFEKWSMSLSLQLFWLPLAV